MMLGTNVTQTHSGVFKQNYRTKYNKMIFMLKINNSKDYLGTKVHIRLQIQLFHLLI